MFPRSSLRPFALVLLILAGASLSSCSREDAKRVRVGSILGLTGTYAAYGEKTLQGFEIARDEINASGGIAGREIELLIEDSQWEPEKALAAYRKLHDLLGVRFIAGITGSKNALAVAAGLGGDDVVIVDALGSAPKLTLDGGPSYFRVMPSDAFAGEHNAKWAVESGMKHPAVLYIEDDWGSSYRQALEGYLAAAGFERVPAEPVVPEMRDFRQQITRLREHEVDTLFLLVYAREAAGFMQQSRELGFSPTVYGSDNLSSSEFVGAGESVVEGVRVALPTSTEGPRYEQLRTKYQQKYGKEIDANVVKSYDALWVMATGLRQAGADPSKVRALFRSPDFSYEGVSGRIRFDEHGDLIGQQYSRLVYRAGRLVTSE